MDFKQYSSHIFKSDNIWDAGKDKIEKQQGMSFVPKLKEISAEKYCHNQHLIKHAHCKMRLDAEKRLPT